MLERLEIVGSGRFLHASVGYGTDRIFRAINTCSIPNHFHQRRGYVLVYQVLQHLEQPGAILSIMIGGAAGADRQAVTTKAWQLFKVAFGAASLLHQNPRFGFVISICTHHFVARNQVNRLFTSLFWR